MVVWLPGVPGRNYLSSREISLLVWIIVTPKITIAFSIFHNPAEFHAQTVSLGGQHMLYKYFYELSSVVPWCLKKLLRTLNNSGFIAQKLLPAEAVFTRTSCFRHWWLYCTAPPMQRKDNWLHFSQLPTEVFHLCTIVLNCLPHSKSYVLCSFGANLDIKTYCKQYSFALEQYYLRSSTRWCVYLLINMDTSERRAWDWNKMGYLS
jgi:hypothetical protein